MTPGGVAEVVAFLVFVAPGAVFEVVAHRYRPALRTTSFREVNAIVLASLAAWVPVVLLLMIPRLWAPGWFQGAIEVLMGTPSEAFYAPGSALLLLLLAGLPVGLAAWASRHLYADGDRLLNETGWYVALRRPVLDGLRPYLWIQVEGGTLHGGYLIGADLRDVPVADRDIILGPPLLVRHPTANAPEKVEGAERLILNGSSIVSVSTTYVRAGRE